MSVCAGHDWSVVCLFHCRDLFRALFPCSFCFSFLTFRSRFSLSFLAGLPLSTSFRTLSLTAGRDESGRVPRVHATRGSSPAGGWIALFYHLRDDARMFPCTVENASPPRHDACSTWNSCITGSKGRVCVCVTTVSHLLSYEDGTVSDYHRGQALSHSMALSALLAALATGPGGSKWEEPRSLGVERTPMDTCMALSKRGMGHFTLALALFCMCRVWSCHLRNGGKRTKKLCFAGQTKTEYGVWSMTYDVEISEITSVKIR